MLKISGLSDEYWSSWDSGENFFFRNAKIEKNCLEEQIKKKSFLKKEKY